MTKEEIITIDWEGISSLKEIAVQDKKLLLSVMVTIMDTLENDNVQHYFTYFNFTGRNGNNICLKLEASIMGKLLYKCIIDNIIMFYFCPDIPIIFTALFSMNDWCRKP